MKRRELLASLLACGPAWASGVGSALDRPALAVPSPSRAVLLGAALAGSRLVAVGERGVVAVSEDSGRSWNQARVPVSVTLTAVGFASPSRGYATGHGGTVLGTSDGGQTWTQLLDGRVIASLMQQAAQRSGDARQKSAADRLAADGPDKPLLDLEVSDESTVLVVGAYGLALATSDAGRTWSVRSDALPNPKGLHLYSVRRRDKVVAIAGEQGLFLLSDDGDHSFRAVPMPYQGSFFTLELLSANGILAAGMRGNAWHSSDEGASWQQMPLRSPAAITGSSRLSNGGVMLSSQSGRLLYTIGSELTAMQLPPLPPLTGVLAVSQDALLALSVEGAHVLPVSASATKHPN